MILPRNTRHTAQDARGLPRRERGEQRFWSITYSQIAEWTGLKLSSVRTYGARRLFDPHDIDGTLKWVNERRQRLGLPLIGQLTTTEE